MLATHVPVAGEVVASFGDKSLHLVAYAALAFLAHAAYALRFGLFRRGIAKVLAALALFGILDEATQTPFGRTADVQDWFADLAGLAAGTGAMLAMVVLARRWFGTARLTDESAA